MTDLIRALPFVLPLAVYMLTGSAMPGGTDNYVSNYGYQIGATFLALLVTLPVWARLRWTVTPLAWIVGALGGLVWIGLSVGHWEWQLMTWAGQSEWVDSIRRAEFNPWTAIDDPTQRLGFLGIRFFGLVLIVPLAEELMLRGFLLRFFSSDAWWTVPVGSLTRTAIWVAVAYGVLSHPSEMLAAAVWFTMITWLSNRTHSFGACVVAHAVTNLLLGIYVVARQDWTLW